MGFLGDGFCGILALFVGSWGTSRVSEVHNEPAEPSKNQGGNFLVVVPPWWPNCELHA